MIPAPRHPSTRSIVCTALCVAFVTVSGCKTVTSLTVPMEYRGTSVLDVNRIAGTVSGVQKVYVAPVADNRGDTTDVGVNQEDDIPVPILPGSSPSEFVHRTVKQELQGAGVAIVEDAAQAGRVLSLELVRFWCTETSTYRTEVRAMVKVADASGGVLWEGQSNGTSQRFGRSLEVENYQETFSDATIKLVENLLSNSDFVKALK